MYNTGKNKGENEYMAEVYGIKYNCKRVRIEKMVNEYIKTGDYVKSYMKAYNPKTKVHLTVKANAFRVYKTGYFNYFYNKRIKQLEEKMDNEVIMNRERILKELEEILIKTKSSEQYNIALKALDQISKMLGVYSPEKSEVTHKGIIINYIKPENKDKK
jgi:hypothetical protein